MVRRTRGFIRDVYAETDPENGRKFLRFEDETRSYFPDRIPRTVRFAIDERSATDAYAKLYAQPMIDLVNALTLPRYGLGNYIAPAPDAPPTPSEARIMQDLSRAGRRLMGFCRTNLFKRLESSGYTPSPSTKPQGMTSAGSKSSHPPSRYTWTKKAASPRNFISARATPPVRSTSAKSSNTLAIAGPPADYPSFVAKAKPCHASTLFIPQTCGIIKEAW